MNKIELEMIEKRFYKKSFKKDYITGKKEITYFYPTESDYVWHKNRLIEGKRDDRPKWQEIGKKEIAVELEGDIFYCLEVVYKKEGVTNYSLYKK